MNNWRSSKQKEIDTWSQDQVTPPFQYYVMSEEKDDITLTAAVSKGDEVIAVSAGHGFTGTGEFMVIQEGDIFLQAKVKSVATNNITLESPSSSAFTTDAIVIRGLIDLNVDGSVTEKEFVFNKRGGIPIDIQYIHVTIWNASAAGDDGKFGDLAELTNGLLVRKEDGTDQSLGNYKSNSSFRDLGAQVDYNDKAGAGTYGVSICFRIKETYGVVLRFDPDTPDVFKVTVRDNLSTLNKLNISLMGQYTQGE
jgi:hypothetical protein